MNLRFLKTLTVPYDLGRLKELEASSSAELRRRALIVMMCGLAGYLALGTYAYLAWAAIYMVALVVWRRLVPRLPDQADGPLLLTVLGMSALQGLIYVSIMCYSWTRPEQVLQFVAILGLAGAMLHTVSFRAEEPLLTLSDFFTFSTAMLWMWLDYALDPHKWGEKLFLAILMVTVVIYFYGALRDSAEAQSKLRLAQKIEARREKLQALGQLTGGVAHDFNNLLTVIIGNLELRKEVQDSPEDHESLLLEVEAAAKKASVLTSQLLTFSRKSPLDPTRIQLGDAVKRARVLLRRLLPATHALDLYSEDDLPEIEVDVGKLETVIVNLVMNARDSMPRGGRIRLSLHDRVLPLGLDPAQISLLPATGGVLRPGHYLELRVQDHGSGIPEDLMPKILEPYFTTKPVGKGSGLGLPMALGFAEQSGGTLVVTSSPENGTTVSLWFPALGARPAERMPIAPAA